MTLLHQAAQKAVEALKLTISARTAPNEWDLGVFETAIEKCEVVLRQVESALQQQPEPVAYTDPLYLRIKQLGGTFTCSYEPFPGVFTVPLYTAPPALQERRRTEYTPGGLPITVVDDVPALQHQEVPREPVAVARPLTSEEEEAAWNSITEQGCSCCTAAVRLFCCLNGITLSDAVLAASPSTTQQQEAGSGWRPIESAPKDGSEMLLSNGQIVAQGWWEHQEPYIREHRDMDGRYIDQDEHDGYGGWLDFAGGMLPEPTHWQPMPAAPSTPEKAGGVPASIAQCDKCPDPARCAGDARVRGFVAHADGVPGTSDGEKR